MLPKFEIGRAVSKEFVTYKDDESGFYSEMCRRVGQVRAIQAMFVPQKCCDFTAFNQGFPSSSLNRPILDSQEKAVYAAVAVAVVAYKSSPFLAV